MLLKHLSRQRQWVPTNNDDLVFTNTRGGHLNYQNVTKRYFLPALEIAGLSRITPHGMRHSYASALLTAGVPIQEVSKLLGHSDPSVTLRIYAHVLPESEKDTAKKLDEIFATTALPRDPIKEER
jgi:integrase